MLARIVKVDRGMRLMKLLEFHLEETRMNKPNSPPLPLPIDKDVGTRRLALVLALCHGTDAASFAKSSNGACYMGEFVVNVANEILRRI